MLARVIKARTEKQYNYIFIIDVDLSSLSRQREFLFDTRYEKA